jgi:hypothetical protein
MRRKGKRVGVGEKSDDGVTLGKGREWNRRNGRERREGRDTRRWCQEVLKGLGARLK